jgi:hypothetical protein
MPVTTLFDRSISEASICNHFSSRHWKDHFNGDLRSDQDHILKKDLRSDQDHIYF